MKTSEEEQLAMGLLYGGKMFERSNGKEERKIESEKSLPTCP
jgi:hypothetical protein